MGDGSEVVAAEHAPQSYSSGAPEAEGSLPFMERPASERAAVLWKHDDVDADSDGPFVRPNKLWFDAGFPDLHKPDDPTDFTVAISLGRYNTLRTLVEQSLFHGRPLPEQVQVLFERLTDRDARVGILDQENDALRLSNAALQSRLSIIDEVLGRSPRQIGINVHIDEDGVAAVLLDGQVVVMPSMPDVDCSTIPAGAQVLVRKVDEGVLILEDLFSEGLTGDVFEVLGANPITGTIIAKTGERKVALQATEGIDPANLPIGATIIGDEKTHFAFARINFRNANEATPAESEFTEVDHSRNFGQFVGLAPEIDDIRGELTVFARGASLMAAMGDRPARGLLLYGPPGCGKSEIARTMAAFADRERSEHFKPTQFIEISGSQYLDKYQGETERRIKALFDRLEVGAHDNDALYIVYIDEIDALTSTRNDRGENKNGHVQAFTNGFDRASRYPNVLFIASTNRPDLLDPAVVRPGRFDISMPMLRPDDDGVRAMVAHYFQPDYLEVASFAVAPDATAVEHIGNQILATARQVPLATLHFEHGTSTEVTGRTLLSPAMIRNIAREAKSLAVRAALVNHSDVAQISSVHVDRALRNGFSKTGTLPAATSLDGWIALMGPEAVGLRKVDLARPEAVAIDPNGRGPGTGQYL